MPEFTLIVVINNYSSMNSRDDQGRLWENYCLSERMKINHYQGKDITSFFWRTYDQQEIDLVEDSMGQLAAFEFKWRLKPSKIPKAFSIGYPDASFEIINPDSYYNFIAPVFHEA